MIEPWIEAAVLSTLGASWCMSSNVTYFYTDTCFWIDQLDGGVPKLIQNPILDGAALEAKWHPLLDQAGDQLYTRWFLREPQPMPEFTKGTKEAAAAANKVRLAYRLKENGLPMFYDPPNFWTQQEDGHVRPFKGVTVRHKEDWMPVANGSSEHKLFIDKFGPTPQSIDGNWMEWTAAIGASPVSVAMRRDSEGKLWVRRSRDETWIYSIMGQSMQLEHASGFRHMNHWTPMPEDHPLAKCYWRARTIPYRDPKFPPSWMPADQIEEWVATGTCAADQKLRAKRDADLIAEKQERSPVRTWLPEPTDKNGRTERQMDIVPIATDEDKHVYVDRPEPQVLASLIPLVTALSDTTKMMVEIGDKETASALAKQVGYLVGGASWHLRANRTEFARRRKT